MATPSKTPPGADPKQLERTGTVREIGSQAVWSLSSCKPGQRRTHAPSNAHAHTGPQLEMVEPSGWIHISLMNQRNNEPVSTFMIQIAVLANHQNGRDTHMRQIKVYTPVEESSIGKFPRCTTVDFMMYRSIR
ncbi:Anaphase-promoting complex subunit 10 [Liparis tanakae]|uniref:Anaphase-promoting complex subunit 10 n=1 Tax=Liparis tanakae TaxID=230148 RepID=A0A4Z2ID84_9TELE|nr:Anaphase-promoting complex subunit 10 [Liparis tanakae]